MALPLALARPGVELDAEDPLQRGVLYRLLALRRLLQRALGEQLFLLHAAQGEEELGPLVEPRAHAIERGGDVLAEIRRVRTGAGEFDLLGIGEEPGAALDQGLQHAVGELAAE